MCTLRVQCLSLFLFIYFFFWGGGGGGWVGVCVCVCTFVGSPYNRGDGIWRSILGWVPVLSRGIKSTGIVLRHFYHYQGSNPKP